MIIDLIQISLLALAGLPVIYLMMLSILALLARKKSSMPVNFYRTFAVVVPAHNEEMVIERTLHSLQGMFYPKEMVDIIVVADNCTDRTADIARSSGAIVLERIDPIQRGKGYALRWCFDNLLKSIRGYEGIVVIDADSAVSRNFLQVMNYYLEHDAKAIQASDLVAPASESWSSEATRLGFTLYNYVRPLGRRVIGCSSGLRGNGMCFATDTLRKYPWQAFSLTEDLQYGLDLVLNDVQTVFAPEAMVLATMPADPANAESQRARWEAGRLPVTRSYIPRLLRHAIGHGSFRSLDACIDLATPPFVALFAFVCATALFTAAGALLNVPGMNVFATLWLAVVCAGMLHVILGFYASGLSGKSYRMLLLFPRYAMWKIMLYAKLIRKKPASGNTKTEWIRTTREQVSTPR